MLPLPEDPVWIYPKTDPDWVQTIVKEFKIHPVTAQVLASRGFTDLEEIHDYLYAKLPNLLDPNLFPDMDRAVERIDHAIKNGEPILIYGDNDVDGMAGTALLTEFLRYIGAKTFFYIPNRASLKQSLIHNALECAKENHCKLLITVDCGISIPNEMTQAKSLGVDVIITDHHEPATRVPGCIATLNPKLPGSSYPNRELTGVGVAFKLAHAITNHFISTGKIHENKIDLKKYLDLVALGTVADMGSLLGENRILVRYGLKQLRKARRVGLSKLFSICEIKPSEISPIDIASKIAPRLNSLGRIADPIKGIELLLMRDVTEAESLAKELDLNNLERQKIERKDSEDLELYILNNPQILQEKALVLVSDRWHPGIIPIITARLTKQYNRPTVLIALEQGLGKGSIRTIPEFPLLKHLQDNADILENFGGHDFAAGMSIKEENIAEFRKRFIAAANNSLLEQDVQTKLYIDAKIQFKDLTFDFMESLSLLEPFGNENPFPIFYCTATQTRPPKIVGKTHLKFYLQDNERELEGIGFGFADKRSRLCKKSMHLEIAFTPHINNFLNKSSIQLQIRDFRAIN